MAKKEEQSQSNISLGIFVIAVLILVTLLIAVINIGKDLATTWLCIVVQILLAILGVASVFCLLILLSQFVLGKIHDIESRYNEEIKRLKHRAPTFVAAMCLFVNGTMVVTGKAYSSDTITTVLVSLLLLLIFWIANVFAMSQNTSRRIFGNILYLFGFLCLPIIALCYHDWNLQNLWHQISKLELETQVVIVLTILLFVCLPLLCSIFREK